MQIYYQLPLHEAIKLLRASQPRYDLKINNLFDKIIMDLGLPENHDKNKIMKLTIEEVGIIRQLIRDKNHFSYLELHGRYRIFENVTLKEGYMILTELEYEKLI